MWLRDGRKITNIVCHDVEPVDVRFQIGNIKPFQIPVRGGLRLINKDNILQDPWDETYQGDRNPKAVATTVQTLSKTLKKHDIIFEILCFSTTIICHWILPDC